MIRPKFFDLEKCQSLNQSSINFHDKNKIISEEFHQQAFKKRSQNLSKIEKSLSYLQENKENYSKNIDLNKHLNDVKQNDRKLQDQTKIIDSVIEDFFNISQNEIYTQDLDQKNSQQLIEKKKYASQSISNTFQVKTLNNSQHLDEQSQIKDIQPKNQQNLFHEKINIDSMIQKVFKTQSQTQAYQTKNKMGDFQKYHFKFAKHLKQSQVQQQEQMIKDLKIEKYFKIQDKQDVMIENSNNQKIFKKKEKYNIFEKLYKINKKNQNNDYIDFSKQDSSQLPQNKVIQQKESDKFDHLNRFFDKLQKKNNNILKRTNSLDNLNHKDDLRQYPKINDYTNYPFVKQTNFFERQKIWLKQKEINHQNLLQEKIKNENIIFKRKVTHKNEVLQINNQKRTLSSSQQRSLAIYQENYDISQMNILNQQLFNGKQRVKILKKEQIYSRKKKSRSLNTKNSLDLNLLKSIMNKQLY